MVVLTSRSLSSKTEEIYIYIARVVCIIEGKIEGNDDRPRLVLPGVVIRVYVCTRGERVYIRIGERKKTAR